MFGFFKKKKKQEPIIEVHNMIEIKKMEELPEDILADLLEKVLSKYFKKANDDLSKVGSDKKMANMDCYKYLREKAAIKDSNDIFNPTRLGYAIIEDMIISEVEKDCDNCKSECKKKKVAKKATTKKTTTKKTTNKKVKASK